MRFEINTLVPELWCSDFERSMDFYTDVMGFTVVQRRGRDPHAYLALQGAQIMIAHWKVDGRWEPWHPEPMAYPFGRGINLQFMIDDVEAIHARVLSKGGRPFLDLHDAEIWRTDCMDTRRQFMVLDPDGYLLRFAQSLRTRPVEAKDHDALDEYYASGTG